MSHADHELELSQLNSVYRKIAYEGALADLESDVLSESPERYVSEAFSDCDETEDLIGDLGMYLVSIDLEDPSEADMIEAGRMTIDIVKIYLRNCISVQSVRSKVDENMADMMDDAAYEDARDRAIEREND